MAPLRTPTIRRAVVTALLALGALGFMPGVASAAQPATLRLLGTDPAYKSTTFTTAGGSTVTGVAGLFRLRITPAGGTAVERRGFCVDAFHLIGPNTDYAVSLRTSDDDPRLATDRYGEAGWLIQSAESLVAAAPSGARALEAGALQTAVWQLTDQVRESAPTADAALNARTAELRALAAGRAIGGPITVAPASNRGCAGRSTVALTLTGRPGSTATLAVAGATGTVSPAEVRFAADGTAQASVTSSTPGTVSVTARSEGGTLTRIARSTTGATTPQETLVLVPQSYSATASVVFEDCGVIPFEEPPTTPTTPTTPSVPVAPLETPTAKPVAPATPPADAAPRTPSQTSPRFTVTKRGPKRVRAGGRARYTITVVNRGTTTLPRLTLTDVLPRGMSLTRTPAGSRLRGGSLVWRLAPLKAGKSRRVRVNVRVDSDIAGRRCNTAIARGPGIISRKARACTVVKAVRRAISPAVTA